MGTLDLAEFDLALAIHDSMLREVIKAFYARKLTSVIASENPLRMVYLSEPVVSFPSTKLLSLEFQFINEVYAALVFTMRGSFTINFLLTDVNDKDKNMVKINFVDLVLGPKIMFEPLFKELDHEEFNAFLDPLKPMVGIPADQTAVGYFTKKMNDTVKKFASSLPLLPSLSQFTNQFPGFSVANIASRFNIMASSTSLLIGVNFFPMDTKPGVIQDLKTFLPGSSTFALGIHKRVLEAKFKKFWKDMPKKYNLSGGADEDGSITLTKLTFTFNDGNIGISGALELDIWIGTIEVAYSGKAYLEMKDGQLSFAVKDVDAGVTGIGWLLAFFTNILTALIMVILFEIITGVVEDKVKNLVNAKSVIGNLGDKMEYELSIPAIDKTLKLAMQNLQLCETGILMDGQFQAISPPTETVPWPQTPVKPFTTNDVSIEKINPKVLPGTWTIDKPVDELTDEEMNAFIMELKSITGYTIPDKETMKKNWSTIHIEGHTTTISSSKSFVTIKPQKWGGNLTYTVKLNGKSTDKAETFAITEKKNDKLAFQYEDINFQMLFLTYASYYLPGVEWLQFEVKIQSSAGHSDKFYISIPSQFFFNSIDKIYGGTSEKIWNTWKNQTTNAMQPKWFTSLTEAILLATLQVDENQTMVYQEKNGDPKPVDNVATLGSYLQNSKEFKDIQKGFEKFAEFMAKNVKLVPKTTKATALQGSSIVANKFLKGAKN